MPHAAMIRAAGAWENRKKTKSHAPATIVRAAGAWKIIEISNYFVFFERHVAYQVRIAVVLCCRVEHAVIKRDYLPVCILVHAKGKRVIHAERELIEHI